MKAIFYDSRGQVVWITTRDANYEFNNLTRAMHKGAVSGQLLDDLGNVLHQTTIQRAGKK